MQTGTVNRMESAPCFDTDLTAAVVVNQVVLMLTRRIYMTQPERSVSKQGHLQPASLTFIGQVTKHRTVKWPILTLSIDMPLIVSP